MSRKTHTIFLVVATIGFIVAAVGNWLKKSGHPAGPAIQYPGVAALAVFWIYSLYNILKSKFWASDTKWMWFLIVLIANVVGATYYYFKRRDLVNVYEENKNNEHIN